MRANHVRMVCLEDVSCAQNDIANYLEWDCVCAMLPVR